MSRPHKAVAMVASVAGADEAARAGSKSVRPVERSHRRDAHQRRPVNLPHPHEDAAPADDAAGRERIL